MLPDTKTHGPPEVHASANPRVTSPGVGFLSCSWPLLLHFFLEPMRSRLKRSGVCNDVPTREPTPASRKSLIFLSEPETIAE